MVHEDLEAADEVEPALRCAGTMRAAHGRAAAESPRGSPAIFVSALINSSGSPVSAAAPRSAAYSR